MSLSTYRDRDSLHLPPSDPKPRPTRDLRPRLAREAVSDLADDAIRKKSSAKIRSASVLLFASQRPVSRIYSTAQAAPRPL